MDIFEKLKAIKAKAEQKEGEADAVTANTFPADKPAAGNAAEQTGITRPAAIGGGIGRIGQLAGRRPTTVILDTARSAQSDPEPAPVDRQPAAPEVASGVGQSSGGRPGLLKPAGAGLVRKPLTTPATAPRATIDEVSQVAITQPEPAKPAMRPIRRIATVTPEKTPDAGSDDMDAIIMAAMMGNLGDDDSDGIAVGEVADPAIANQPSDATNKSLDALAETPTRKPLFPANSALARIKAGADERLVRKNAVSNDGAICAAGATSEPVYSPEQFIEDWPAMPEGDDWHPEIGQEYLGTAANVIQNGCKRINQLFDEHLSGLTVQRAPEPVIREIGAIVKLTFLRVKDAPGAYDMLDLTDRATLIKGLRAMTAKRHAAAVARAPRDASSMSAALENMVTADPSLKDMLGGMDFNLDLGAL